MAGNNSALLDSNIVVNLNCYYGGVGSIIFCIQFVQYVHMYTYTC